MKTATIAAGHYLVAHKLQADADALAMCLKSWCRIKLPQAMADAKAALEAHMDEAAQQTFALKMMEAGVEAAKEAGFPAQGSEILVY
jgi:hypothetical protein